MLIRNYLDDDDGVLEQTRPSAPHFIAGAHFLKLDRFFVQPPTKTTNRLMIYFSLNTEHIS
jgi:hypothetical protein